MNPALDRLLRTVMQFVVSGAFTTLVTALAGGLSPSTAVIVLAVAQMVVTYTQNALEDAGKIPVLLKKSSEAEYAQQLGMKKGDISDGNAP